MPFFAVWMERANEEGVRHATAVTLSTATPNGVVSARTVILKAWDATRFVFESETYSRKGVELAANPYVAMTMYWREPHRQICVTGKAAPLPVTVSDEMWARRGRPNQAASVVSHEGSVLSDAAAEVALQDAADRLLASDDPMPRPATYVAYEIVPLTIEFWEGSEDRLHRRLFYERSDAESSWRWRRIAP